MLVTIKREVFDALDPVALEWACLEPLVRPLHGIDPQAKVRAYTEFTPGQRAMFMFQVLYGHAGEEAGDLYCCVSNVLKEPKTWYAIKAGVRYFGDDAMLQILEEMESLLGARHQQRDAVPWDLDEDSELGAAMNRLNATFHAMAPTTLKLIGEYVRNNPRDFVLIEE